MPIDASVSSVWTQWHGHPDVLIGLVLIESAYLLAIGVLGNRSGRADRIDPKQIAIFTSGILVIFLSLTSPLHHLSNEYLFSAHMLQHVLLTLVAPPLLVLGTPGWIIREVTKPRSVFAVAKIMTNPIVAFLLFNASFSLWHIPALYNLSVTNHGWHIFEHILFMSTAVLLWWPITSTVAELPRLSYPLRILYIFLVSIAQIIVFAPITFATEPIYEWYTHAPRITSLNAVADQQVGAIIMKVGGGVFLMVVLIVAFFRWYNNEENKSPTEFKKVGYGTEV